MTEQYKCQSYYDDDNVLQDCTCGKCDEDNTKPEFFKRWPKEELVKECARLNQVLKEIAEIAEQHNSENEL